MKRHSISMTAAWAKENGMKGYEHLYPEVREKNKQRAIAEWNSKNREKELQKQQKK